MDRQAEICRTATTGPAIGRRDGWFVRQSPDPGPALVVFPRPRVSAMVHGKYIHVRSVRGWWEPAGESVAAGTGDGFDRRAFGRAPCEACEWREDAARIRAALDTLPGRYRQALFLVYVEGRTHGEAAIHLAVPLGTAKAWVWRGLRALRVAHASLGAIPTPAVTAASRLLIRMRLEARRDSRVAKVGVAMPE